MIKTAVTLYYSKLYYAAEVWHLPELTLNLKKSIKFASANRYKYKLYTYHSTKSSITIHLNTHWSCAYQESTYILQHTQWNPSAGWSSYAGRHLPVQACNHGVQATENGTMWWWIYAAKCSNSRQPERNKDEVSEEAKLRCRQEHFAQPTTCSKQQNREKLDEPELGIL